MTGQRLAFLSVTALLTLMLIVRLGQALTNWDGADLDVYRRAAQSWLERGNPYAWGGTSGVGAYRYAPWFAALWIPLLWIPRDVLLVMWAIVLVVATAAVMAAVIRQHGENGVPLALFAGGLLISTAASGNVQPVIVAMLFFSLHRRSGAVSVGLAASLKLVPIIYVIPWIGRGELRKAATAVLVAAMLLAPALLFELPVATTDPGAGEYSSPVLWVILAGPALIAAALLSRSRYSWLAAGTAALLAIPRLLPVDFSIVVPAAARTTLGKTGPRTSVRRPLGFSRRNADN